MELKHFKGCNSLEDVKIKYRILSKRYHPDKGGAPEIMQEVNQEHDFIKKNGIKTPKVEVDKVKIEFEGFVFEFDSTNGITQDVVDKAIAEFYKYVDNKNPILRTMLLVSFKQFMKSIKK